MSHTGQWPPPAGQTPGASPWPWPPARPGWQPVVPWPGAAAPVSPVDPRPGWGPPPAPGYPPYAPPTPWPPPPRRRPLRLPLFIVMTAALLVIAPLITSYVAGLVGPALPNPPVTTGEAPTDTAPGVATDAPYSGLPDLNPNQPPFPTSVEQAAQIVVSSPLYDQSLQVTTCTVGLADLPTGTTDQVEDYLNRLINCLMAAWLPAVTLAGFELPHPSVTVYSGDMTSACGELPAANAVYCTADQQIYYSIDLVRAFPQVVRTMRFLAASVMAHEFAHAVQFRTMILMSQEVLSYTAEEVAEQRELSRRLEMQADCFSGLFLRAVADSTSLTASDERDIATIFAVLGGTEPGADDHGLGVNRAAWATTGLSTLDVGVCQTFSADPDTVS